MGYPINCIAIRAGRIEINFWISITELLDIHETQTAAYHPQCDG